MFLLYHIRHFIHSCNISRFMLSFVFLKAINVSFEKEFLTKLCIQDMKSEPLSSTCMHAIFNYKISIALFHALSFQVWDISKHRRMFRLVAWWNVSFLYLPCTIFNKEYDTRKKSKCACWDGWGLHYVYLKSLSRFQTRLKPPTET